MPLPLSQAEVLDLLAEMHSVDRRGRTALLGRLQHFKRLGFPAGVNTGRGKAAPYGASALVRLLLAFQLLELGLPPDRIVQILHWSIGIAISVAGYGSRFLDARILVGHLDDPAVDRFYVALDPVALGSLGHPDKDAQLGLLLNRFQGVVGRKRLAELMDDDWRRISIIDATRVIDWAAHFLDRSGAVSKIALSAGLKDWADSCEWRPIDGDS